MSRLFFHNFSGRNLPDYSRKSFDTMLVADGVIVKTGFQLSMPLGDIEAIDLAGATVFAAFADAHVHFTQTGITLQGFSMADLKSLPEVFDAVRKESRLSEYVLGWNLQETMLKEARLPTSQELDSICKDKFVWLARADLHSAVLNSKAVQWARKNVSDLNDDHGLVSGDNYNRLSYELMNFLSADFKLQGMKKAEKLCFQKGVSAIHALEGSEGNEGDTLAAAGFFAASPLNGIIYHQAPSPSLPLKKGWKRMGGCLLVDGSIGTRTAAVHEPYSDSPETTGNLYLNAQRLENLLKTASDKQMQIALHAIGDRAVDTVSSVYAWADKHLGKPLLPHRIEHFVMPTNKSLMHTRDSSTMVCIQPSFDHFWGGPNGLYCQRLGLERALSCNSFKTMLDLGIQLAGGSDSPVTPIDPMLGIHALVNHTNPDERIDLNSALSLFISEPHKLCGLDHQSGHLKPGFKADFICFSDDPFSIAPSRLKQLSVKELYIGAKKIHLD